MIALWKTDCDRVRDHLALWASDDLVGEERRQVERHLAGCPRCRAEAARIRGLLDTLAEVGRDDPPGWRKAVADGSLWPALRRQLHEARRPAALADQRRSLSILSNPLGDWLLTLEFRPGWLLAAVALVAILPGIWIAATHPFALPRSLPAFPTPTDLADNPTPLHLPAGADWNPNSAPVGHHPASRTDRFGNDELVARADYPVLSSTSFEADHADSPPQLPPTPNSHPTPPDGFGVVDRAVSGLTQ
ncbi:hypothetical protein Isop_1389 [Isosphaera pallida ATCC 43644]|uniref:Putative zinc-finger domain-containing protein n=1 Tax=Isosphaera pallida (strain ATCC 43644 / DSM 9630 / IS1B) TaxID=575540 RepID=E8QXD3_ISOPI|nr:zf-HC2 domain-containing protein [Isosphaera pallida]ADV61974.1 hypothetical protein Isop_1389 [Isosphaera pallida ATCC 43644]